MIGVIGPADSVALALRVAGDDGLSDSVIGRGYASSDEAPILARELDPVCQVLLFTGRYAFALGQRSGGLQAALRYVPHSGADLYGAIVRILREDGCELPRVSLDTIEPRVVREAYEDLGLDPPEHVLPLEREGASGDVITTDDIVAFHRSRYREGVVDGCLTCIGSVHAELSADGIPVWRIDHTKSVMREAIRQAHLTARLAIIEATQPATVLVTLAADDPPTAGLGQYESQRRRLRAREATLDMAERLQGSLTELDEGTSMIHTSRSRIENAVTRVMAGHESPFSPDRIPSNMRVGVGLGATIADADENARLALAMGQRDGALHVGFPDAKVVRVDVDRPSTTFRLRETHPSNLRVADELGIGPLALTRLTSALRQVDAGAVTATALARAYGIEARSARRLIRSLERAGMATRLGRQGGPRAGRPQTVYRVDMARLLGSEGNLA